MFVFTRWWSAFGAAVVLVALLCVAHLLIELAQKKAEGGIAATHRRQRGVKTLVIGTDGRASTSKLQVLLWTVAVVYAFVFLLIWGRSIGCDGVTGDDARLCREASEVRGTFAEVLEEPLETEYYALLGLPTAAAVAAKALTVNKVANGEVVKRSVPRNQKGVGRALAEVVSSDDGRTDLIDFQYFTFNLLALAYFALEFVGSPGNGLPELPPTLVALSGVAVAAYTGKKALESDAPLVSAVLPRRIRVGEPTTLVVLGSRFGKDGGRLMIDGVAIVVEDQQWANRKIEASVDPRALESLDIPRGGRSGDLVVVTSDDAVSRPYAIRLDPADAR